MWLRGKFYRLSFPLLSLSVVTVGAIPLQENYFELLGISPAFFIDTQKLSDHYRRLQRQFHPDKYVTASAQDQRQALQVATSINEAYQCLKNPLSRADYLLKLVADKVEAHTMQADNAFLFQQMEWREALAMAKSKVDLNHLMHEAQAQASNYEQVFALAYNDKDFIAARHIVDKMHFVSKFQQELQVRAANLPEDH